MKELIDIFRLVKIYIKSNRKVIVGFIIASLLYVGGGIVEPYLLGNFVDYLVINKSYQFIIIYCASYFGYEIFRYVCCYFSKILGTKARNEVSISIKADSLCHIQRTSLSYSTKFNKTEFAKKVNNDTEGIVTFVISLFQMLPGQVICFLLPVIYLFRTNIIVAAAALCLLPVMYGLYRYFKKKLYLASYSTTNNANIFFQHLYEQLFNLKYIKLNHVSGLLSKRFLKSGRRLLEADVHETKVTFFYDITQNNMGILFQVFFYVYGGISIIKGNMTVGNFVIITSYTTMIIESFAYFMSLWHEVQATKVYYDRINEIRQAPEETNGAGCVDDIFDITLKNISFRYENETIIDSFSYKFEKGNIYTVTGENGAGKSTLIGLLAGLYIDEVEGSVLYNDISIKQLDMLSVRGQMFGISEQEPALLGDTIRYNVTYNNEPSQDEKLYELAKVVAFDDYLRGCEKGLDTQVAEGAVNLSGGQKQKISLLKAIYKEAKVLILDEPTSAMDAESQMTFTEFMKNYKKDRIIIIITHDKKIAEIADDRIHLVPVSSELMLDLIVRIP